MLCNIHRDVDGLERRGLRRMRLEYYANISAALFEHHLVGRARPRPLEGLLAREALVVRDERAGVDPCGGFE